MVLRKHLNKTDKIDTKSVKKWQKEKKEQMKKT